MVPLRRHLDLRTVDEVPCELTISGRAEEVVHAAVDHAVEAHGLRDEPDLRIRIRAALSEVQPLVPAPGRKLIDCQDLPGLGSCSLCFTGPADDVVRAATAHLVQAHRHRWTEELEDEVRLSLRDLSWEREPAAPGP